ncbi:MAG: ATP-binding protein, partial [Thiovulaceae bacterium]|nr:ATP-binding protein [Sulfurimonadaceae bacterium]
FSKIEAGKLELEKKDFQISEITQILQDTFEYQAEQKGIVFTIDSHDEYPVLSGDPLRLTQVLTNLSSNALKFTTDGQVLISYTIIDEGDDYIRMRFSVKDSGIGMTKDTIDKLFKPFSQADSSMTRQFGGTGLGLRISKQLVGLMNGNIWVKSTLKKGSEFIFTAVFGKAIGSSEILDNGTKIEEICKILKDLRVLVAEDNKTNQLVIMGMLEDYVAKIDFANNGKEAVEMSKKTSYDVVLMDIQMPIMNGFEATKNIQKSCPKLPIIALTANAMKEDMEKTKNAGMKGHVSKPIEIKYLMKTIAFAVK